MFYFSDNIALLDLSDAYVKIDQGSITSRNQIKTGKGKARRLHHPLEKPLYLDSEWAAHEVKVDWSECAWCSLVELLAQR